ncbi:MAG: hypothetical protein AAF206_11845 [Bacteroidota bacterium]
MKRRDFLKGMAPLGLAPLVLNGIPIRAMASPLNITQFDCDDVKERALVIVQLHGGNDGLNTIIPLEQYSQYRNKRPKIGIRDNGNRKYISLDNTLPQNQQSGLHPDLGGLKDLYDRGMAHFVMGVNYNNNDKSHFKSSNIWLTGSDGVQGASANQSGWMGRYLDHRFINYPLTYPNAELPDPPALEFNSKTVSLGFHRQSGVPMGLSAPVYIETRTRIKSDYTSLRPTPC